MTQQSGRETRLGVLAMIGACMIWGLAPIFYRLLDHVPTQDILAHRILWSFVFFALVLRLQGRFHVLRKAMTIREQVGWVIVAALFISVNWFVFIYSIQAGRLTESSLGYYIFPLVSVFLGYVIFRERMTPLQWLAVALAVIAVLTMTLGLGTAPWISIVLALSFGAYGVVKKKVTMGPVVSVTAEVMVVLPLVLAWFFYQGTAIWPSTGTIGLLILSGPLTATPLILFSFAAQRIRLSSVGLLQYINPTMQFAVAALVFGEAMTRWHLYTFIMIWLALAIYSGVAVAQDRALRRARIKASTVGTV